MRVLICHSEYQQKGGEEATVATESALLESAGHAVFKLIVPNADYKALRLALNYFWSSDVYHKVADAIMTKFPTPDVVHFITSRQLWDRLLSERLMRAVSRRL